MILVFFHRVFFLYFHLQCTGCVLHNMLLKVDGLDQNWEQQDAAALIQRILAEELVNVDEDDEDDGDDDIAGADVVDDENVDVVAPLDEEPTFAQFQQALIEHFFYRFESNDPAIRISWPKRNASFVGPAIPNLFKA